MPASPCTQVCQMDTRTGWCRGCARSIDEITVWSRADEVTQQRILDQLPERRCTLQSLGLWLAPASARRSSKTQPP